MNISNSYLSLGEQFYQKINPKPVSNPQMFLWNANLETDLNLSKNLLLSQPQMLDVFSGNVIHPPFESIALAYAGHQFGHFNPQLGDGRAHLLGDFNDRFGQRKELQLKGSGPTTYSRRGDGRYALGPAIREFIMSDAMHALGVPTTRSLCVVTTGEDVYRESIEPGAVLTRVASSHIRVGMFEYFMARQDQGSLKALADFAIKRHDPELLEAGDDRYLLWLKKVIKRQIILINEWLRVGFIHGVMNTDNTAISGETIDYGPCAMMGTYKQNVVFSSIDQQSRYAFGNQANIAQWNMARFAETLLTLIDKDSQKALDIATEVINDFPSEFKASYYDMMAKKIGIDQCQQQDRALIDELLTLMEQQELDYTITFKQLMESFDQQDVKNNIEKSLPNWFEKWQQRLIDSNQLNSAHKVMRKVNPVVIPRNHHIENTIQACLTMRDPKPAHDFIDVLKHPYQESAQTKNYQDAAPESDEFYKTFCGT